MLEKNMKKSTSIKKTASPKKTTTKKTVAKKSAAVKKTTAPKKAITVKKTTTKKTVAKKSSTGKKTATAKKSTTLIKKKVIKKSAVKKIVEKADSQSIRYVPTDVDVVRELPDRYNETKLMLMVRDPEWTYFYWDISDSDYSSNNLSKRNIHVKIFRLSGVNISKHDEYIDVQVSSSYGSWYVMLGLPHCYFIAELGYYDEKGHFIVLTRSNIVYTPRNAVSDLYDDDWTCNDELSKVLFESYNVSNTLSSASLFNMINVYAMSTMSSHLFADKKQE